MDLGCFDMGCIETQRKDTAPENESSSSSSGCGGDRSSGDSSIGTSKIRKNKAMKEAGQSNLSNLNKCASQIRKPPHRRTSPLNWFPRKKGDSYLQRKIKLLQEVDGMNSTLDETLGDSNPHYSRVLKEKIAAREAATKAMEAHKAAMVEASWCRILQAARIEGKDAEVQLLDAEKIAAEAFEAASAVGVIMYDIPDCPQKYYKIETSAEKGGGSTTHTVSASFETAFEVDKQVASAVKSALTKLANCPSINKDDFRELLRLISQNPDSERNSQELSEFSSECESDTGSEFELGLQEDGCNSLDDNSQELCKARQMKYKKQEASGKFNKANLVEIMLERLKGLQEDELASLATIVATSGLSAALAEGENRKKQDLGSTAECNSDAAPDARAGSFRNMDRQFRMDEGELPSLDKFLVKRLTRLEREVLEAKNARKNEAKEGNRPKQDKMNDKKLCSFDNTSSNLGTMLVKHSSKLEKDIEEARKNQVLFEANGKKLNRVHSAAVGSAKPDVTELPGLDIFLVKHVSRLEREVQEAKNRRNLEPVEHVTEDKKSTSVNPFTSAEEKDPVGKENIDLNKNVEVDPNRRDFTQGGTTTTLPQEPHLKETEALLCEDGHHEDKEGENCNDKMKETSLRSDSRTEKQVMRNGQNGSVESESLDKILVKHVSRLEKEKMLFNAEEVVVGVKKKDTKSNLDKCTEESLDKLLVKHKSKLEREKMAAAQQSEDQIRHSTIRRTAREKELQEAWGGLSLGNSIRPHLTRLERDKASNLDKCTEESLDKLLVKHKSKLEREKMAAAQQSEDQIRHSTIRRAAREKELQEAWGGLSLGNSIRPHLSRLERDKAAWLKAEEEERRKAMEKV